MEATFTKAEILAAMKAWYKDNPGYTEKDAEEAVDWIVQTMEDTRGQPEPI